MKQLLLLTLIFLSLCNYSCDNNNGEDYASKAYPKGTKQWGYFEGSIDDKQVNAINKSYSLGRSPVFSIRHAIDESPTIKADSINYIYTEITVSEDIALGIALFKFTPKIRYASVTSLLNSNEGYIKVLLKKSLSYIPKENSPFKIEIIDIDWESPLDPIIEVEISGRLFNQNNPDDSIIVNGIYGTR